MKLKGKIKELTALTSAIRRSLGLYRILNGFIATGTK